MSITANTHIQTHQSSILIRSGEITALKSDTGCTSGVMTNTHWEGGIAQL